MSDEITTPGVRIRDRIVEQPAPHPIAVQILLPIPARSQGLVGKTVFVTLFNGRRVEGRVTAMLNTVAGIKYRVVSGDLLFQVSRKKIVDMAQPMRERPLCLK